jgi:hypothetical protein
MLSVAMKPFMLSIVMLSVIILNVEAPFRQPSFPEWLGE